MATIIREEIITNDRIEFMKAERFMLGQQTKQLYTELGTLFNAFKNKCETEVRALFKFQRFEFNVTEHSMTFKVLNENNEGVFGTEIKLYRSERYLFNDKYEFVYEINCSCISVKLGQPNYYLDHIKLLGEIAENNEMLVVLYEELFTKYNNLSFFITLKKTEDKIQHLNDLIRREVDILIDDKKEKLLNQDIIPVKKAVLFGGYGENSGKLYEDYALKLENGRNTFREVQKITVLKRNKATLNVQIEYGGRGYTHFGDETIKTAVFEEWIRLINNWNLLGALATSSESFKKHYENFKYNLK